MWAALGAPFDSAAKAEGEERAPDALRAAGLIELLGCRDLGDVAPPLRPPVRDERTGIIAFDALVDGSEAIAAAVSELASSGERPLVLGGDCSLLIGVVAGLRRAGLDPGLLFVDGHADYFDGETSPTGEAADMDLALLHGAGPVELTALVEPPLIAPERTVILGHRPPKLHPDVAFERERVPAAVLQLDAPAIRGLGPAEAARQSLEHLSAAPELWLHLDLDALDEAELPAVSYPQTDGLSWQQLEELLGALIATGVAGISIADFNPDLDPDGRYATRITELLARLLAKLT